MSEYPGATLWTTAACNRALEPTVAAVFVVGGGALGLVDALGSEAAALPVIELELGESGPPAEQPRVDRVDPQQCVFFSPHGTGDDAAAVGLEPMRPPPALAAAATYLDGARDARTEAIVGAIEALVRPTPARAPALIGSGSQAELAGSLIDGLTRTLRRLGAERADAVPVSDLVHELAVLREDYQALLRALGPAQRAHGELEALLAERDATLAGLIGSTSWRLTAPLRRLAATRRRRR